MRMIDADRAMETVRDHGITIFAPTENERTVLTDGYQNRRLS